MYKKLVILMSLITCMLVGVFTNTTKLFASSDYIVTVDYNVERLEKYLPENVVDKLNNYSIDVSSGSYIDEPLITFTISRYYTCEWTINGIEVDVESYPITKNTTFVAKWTPKITTIYYNYLDGEESEITNLELSKECTIEDGKVYYYRPKRPGYKFVDWYTDRDYAESSMTMFKDTYDYGTFNLYPKWEPIEYIINYNTDASNIDNPPTYNISTGGFNLANPTKDGYIFKGWYLDPNFTTRCLKIDNSFTGDINLYPLWEAKVYNITYILPDGSIEVINAEHGSTASLPKLDNNIFQIVRTDVSRNNISGDTTIKIRYVNIWYVYMLGLLLVSVIIFFIVLSVIKRNKRMHKLRYIYKSNASQNRRWR